MSHNLPDGMSITSIPGCSSADESIHDLIDSLCASCQEDFPICPVKKDVILCPMGVIEKANYIYYHGDD